MDDDDEEEHLLRQRRRPASEEDVAVGKEVSQISISSHLSSQSLLVNPSEVKQGKVLCSTLKSTVCVALWQGQQVAVKQLKTQDEEDLVAELLHEIHVLSALQHPCLVKLVGANLDKEGPFMLTEYMEHRDVETYMQQQRQNAEDPYYKPSFEVAMGWALNTGQALEYLHGLPCPIIHRDLKPLNLFLTKHLHVKVGDFGISKVMPSTSTRVKMTGGVGSWRYMAPEVARHEAYTEKADIYAYALILYFIFSGRQPFHAWDDLEDVLKAFIRGEEPRPDLSVRMGRELRSFLPEVWDDAACRPSAAECLLRLSDMKAPSLRESVADCLCLRCLR
ncbi:unnamed protein product [Effrenium voratum]|uniref:Protein kinase domain-containing protein n=1 Tax=Effrenium voratum TaxID=2562239 RepID=A0AA36HVL8_9DINO|nr:unnamed protein product [Effrenium voratum]CAJ1421758.1 unnamed protein product [Effrenium voratum]